MTTEITEFNKDELEAPQWINAEFFTTVLKQCTQRDDIQVKQFKMSPASAKGDHYASVMFRGTVEYTSARGDEQKSLIIKTMPEYDGPKLEMLSESHIFETEIGMYSDVIPKIEAILRSVGDDTKIGPPCLYHSLSPKKLIVFEDLIPLGYTVIRDRSVNMDELKGAYTKLAKLQAASLKMLENDPSCFDIYRHHFMSMPTTKDSPFITDGIGNFIEMLEKEPSLKEYLKFFTPVKESLIDHTQKPFLEYWTNRSDDTLYVLGHGDFHGKNMMFKLSPNGQYEDVLLLDFQMSYMGSFVLDLLYSMFMLVSREVRVNQMKELFALYIEIFNETADKIGYSGRRPDMKQLVEESKRNRHLIVFMLSTFLPMWVFFNSKMDMEPDDFMQSNDCRRKLYENELYIDELKELLPKYKALGYFDDL